MDKGLGFIILLTGLFGGFVLGNMFGGEPTEIAPLPHSHVDHELLNVEGDVPDITLTVSGDNSIGFDANIDVTNFRFTPENSNGEYVEGEGHAHIYVDGEKINRVYGEWYHLGKFGLGSHEIEVRLSSNDHKELAVNDESIKANTIIVVREGDIEEDDHMHMDGEEDNMEIE